MNFNPEHQNSLFDLVNEFEAMSEKGNITFLNEKDFNKLINYYEQEFLFDKALMVANRAIEQHGFSADFHIKKAQLLLALRNGEKAMSSLDQAEIFAPAEVEIQILRAKVFTSMGDYSNALLILDRIKEVECSPEDLSNAHLCEAHVYECLKDFNRMFDCLIGALQVDPDNEEALERLWVCTELTKEYDRAITFLNELIEINPYSYLAWYNLGHTYSCKGKYLKSINAYEYSFLINEDFELAYRDCADLCFQVQDFQKALGFYIETMSKFGPDCDLLANIGECYYHLKDYAKAKEYFDKASKVDPYNDEVYYFLGLCHFQANRYVSAINAYFRAIEIEDRREEYFCSLAVAFAAIGEYSKANYYFLKASEIGPEQTDIWIEHIKFLLSIGENYQAYEIIEEAEFHAVGPELNYAKVAVLLSIQKRKDALHLMAATLEEDMSRYEIVFDLYRKSKNDRKLKNLIKYYL